MVGDLRHEEAVAKAMASWQGRAIMATKSHTTVAGMILILGLGKRPSLPPFLDGPLQIRADGFLYADRFVDKGGRVWGGTQLAKLSRVMDYFHSLADALKFDDKERAELFTTIRQAIGTDLRPEKDRGFG